VIGVSPRIVPGQRRRHSGAPQASPEPMNADGAGESAGAAVASCPWMLAAMGSGGGL